MRYYIRYICLHCLVITCSEEMGKFIDKIFEVLLLYIIILYACGFTIHDIISTYVYLIRFRNERNHAKYFHLVQLLLQSRHLN